LRFDDDVRRFDEIIDIPNSLKVKRAQCDRLTNKNTENRSLTFISRRTLMPQYSRHPGQGQPQLLVVSGGSEIAHVIPQIFDMFLACERPGTEEYENQYRQDIRAI